MLGKKYFIIIVLFAVLALTGSCKKILNVDNPPTSVDGATVYSKDGDAIAVLTGLYQTVSSSTGFASGINSVTCITGLSGDEFTGYSGLEPLLVAAYKNNLSPSAVNYTIPFWNNVYNYIYVTNTSIQGLSASSSLDDSVKQELLGEAKFMRGFFYFYLTNLFGDVPLVLTTDYKTNSTMSRTSADLVMQQIVKDLKDAQSLLSSTYVGSDVLTVTSERTRPNKWAATALLSRVYLYQKDYADAESQASLLINNDSLFSLVDLNSVFLMNNNEAIWQLEPVLPNYNTQDAVMFILNAAPSYSQPVSLSPQLLQAFDSGDNRKSVWVDSIVASNGNTYYYPFKYKVSIQGKPLTEYLDVLRLGEQYLIRAEARANQNNLTGPDGAIADLNIIRNRAGLSGYAGAQNQTDVLGAIAHERQVELFAEWGHRWFDLKRTAKVDSVMSIVCPEKGGTWSTDWSVYPIPFSEIQLNGNLSQNPGYH